MMTREEARWTLSIARALQESETLLTKAIDMAIEALSQAERPKGRWIKHSWNNYSCSNCETQYIGHGASGWNYCPNCGQAIDWSEEK